MNINITETSTYDFIAKIELYGKTQILSYDELEKVIPGFDRKSVEWLTVQEEGRFIFGLISIDGGKGTLVYGWDAIRSRFVHVTKAPFTETLILDNDTLYILKNVFVLTEELTGYLNLGKQKFGVIDTNEEPEKMDFYLEPEYREYYDENVFWINKIKGTIAAGCNDSAAQIELY